MKKLLTIRYTDWAFNVTMLLVRVTFGGLMLVNHGFEKMKKFSTLQYRFSDPFHIGSRWSLLMVIFAEVFCALLLILGLFSRLAAVPLVIAMAIAFFMAHHGNFGEGESAALFLTAFLAVLMVGPGKASIDGMIGK